LWLFIEFVEILVRILYSQASLISVAILCDIVLVLSNMLTARRSNFMFYKPLLIVNHKFCCELICIFSYLDAMSIRSTSIFISSFSVKPLSLYLICFSIYFQFCVDYIKTYYVYIIISFTYIALDILLLFFLFY